MARFRTPIASPVQKGREGRVSNCTCNSSNSFSNSREKKTVEVPCPPPESAVNSAVTEKGTLYVIYNVS